MLKFDVLTIFPQLFDSFINETLIKKAQEKSLLSIDVHDVRSFTTDVHRQVDDRPFGGGPGMVLMIEPLYAALHSLGALTRNPASTKTILLSPRGRQFDQSMAHDFSQLDRIIFISGRYEGVDARIERYVDEVVSVGPYILSGGELPAMTIIESISRLIPGVLGNEASLKSAIQVNPQAVIESEYPVYTRPESFITHEGESLIVPDVLLSGDHAAIAAWRESHS